jgi:VanZ family protein
MIVLKRYWISILVIIAILILCFINPPQMEAPPMTNFDKLVHFLMFLGLSGILFFDSSFHLKQKVNGWLILGASFLFPVVFGGGIEIAQEYLTSARTGDWMDFLFDSIGVVCSCLICLLINRKLKIN